MTPPVSGSTPTPSTPTPPEAPADRASAPTTSPTSPGTAAPRARASSATPSTPAAPTSPSTQIDLEVDGMAGGLRLGGPGGTLFSPDFSPANEGWNHSRYRAGFGVTYRLLVDPRVQIGVGGSLAYFGLSGDRSAPGRLDGGELGAHVDLRFPLHDLFQPTLRIMASALLATGETTAGNNFSVDSTGGLGVALRALVGVGMRFGRLTLTPSFWAETGVIPNARGTAAAPWLALGASLMASYALGSDPVIQAPGGPAYCEEGNPERIRARIQSLQDQIATLRTENTDIRARVHESHPSLDLDHMDGLQRVPATPVSEPLPTDCDELAALWQSLENERDAVDGQNRMLIGIERVPASAAPRLVRAITRLQEIHFITARPQGTPERVSVREADIATLHAARDAYIATPAGQQHQPMAMPDLENTFRAIFPRTQRQDGTTFSPSLDAISQIATALRSPDMQGVRFYIVGNTDSRGDDPMNLRLSLRRAEAIRDALIMMGVAPETVIPIGRGETQLIYYHDQQRGRDPHTVQRAETQMLQRDGIRGSALADEIRGRQSTNRRVEMFVCREGDTEDATCAQLTREASPPTTGGAASTGGSGAPVQQVEQPATGGTAH